MSPARDKVAELGGEFLKELAGKIDDCTETASKCGVLLNKFYSCAGDVFDPSKPKIGRVVIVITAPMTEADHARIKDWFKATLQDLAQGCETKIVDNSPDAGGGS